MFKELSYEVAGRVLTGLLATPQTPVRGGVLVLHGGTGLGAHERSQCEQLAAAGYLAFAPDLFGETFRDRAQGMAVIGGLVASAGPLRERVTAAWRVLADRTENTAALGHCFGGLAALELARNGAGVRAVASIHGGLTTKAPAQPGSIRARILVCTGAADPYAPREHRAALEDELTAAGADWHILLLANAPHGFSLEGPAHHPLAARRAWSAWLSLLEEVMA